MKKILHLSALLSVLCASAFLGTGCKTADIATTAIKGEGLIITTVDTGMKLWSIYVNAGHATQAQVDEVKKAYTTYYNAQLLAEAALEKYVATGSTNAANINTAQAAVTAAQAPLLNLLNQYLN